MTQEEFQNLYKHVTIVKVTATDEEGKICGADMDTDIVKVMLSGTKTEFNYSDVEIISEV